VIRWLRRAATTETESFRAVGYPKVGNTWLRLSMGYYLQHRYGLSDLPLMDAAERPMLLKIGTRLVGEFTHAPLEWQTQTAADLSAENVVRPFEERRVLFLTRYPLDTLVSLYMQERFRAKESGFTGTIDEFVVDPVFGLEKLIRFHQLWAESATVPAGFHVWRYEDALAQPRETFESALRFLGEPVAPDSVTHAVERSSFANVRALETSGRQPVYKSSNLAIFATGDPANPNALHTRRGQAGGYRSELTPERCADLEARVAAAMPARFGYTVPPAVVS
jgi:hypothetical protein